MARRIPQTIPPMISVFLSDTDEEDVDAMSVVEAASLLEALTFAADFWLTLLSNGIKRQQNKAPIKFLTELKVNGPT